MQYFSVTLYSSGDFNTSYQFNATAFQRRCLKIVMQVQKRFHPIVVQYITMLGKPQTCHGRKGFQLHNKNYLQSGSCLAKNVHLQHLWKTLTMFHNAAEAKNLKQASPQTCNILGKQMHIRVLNYHMGKRFTYFSGLFMLLPLNEH